MKRIFILLLIGVFVFSCSDDDTNCCLPVPECGKYALTVDDEAFLQVETENYSITHVVLNENCLEITISSSGCSGNTWEENLFSSVSVYTVHPNQKALKMELINEELCLAIVEKTILFDLTFLQIEGQNQVVFMLEGWEEPIIYVY